MIHQWQEFFDKNKAKFIENYCQSMLPKIAGIILYNTFHHKSFESIDEMEFMNWADNGDSTEKLYRSVTTYTHSSDRERQYYYRRYKLTSQDTVKKFFECSQFVEYSVESDRNLPCTWADLFSGWLKELQPKFEDYFPQNLDPKCAAFFEHLQNDRDQGDAGLLLALHTVCEKQLFDRLSAYTIGVLDKDFAFFYRSYQFKKKEKNSALEARLEEIKKLKYERQVLGNKLLPEFRTRLYRHFNLIVPRLVFTTEQEIWFQLESVLNTFSEAEKIAILTASNCSTNVYEMYCKKNI